MRIVKRDEMLGMPEGTIYSESDEYANFDGLFWRGVTIFDDDGNPCDWLEFNLLDFERSGIEITGSVIQFAVSGKPLPYFPMEDSSRNADYDALSMYLIFEDIDLRRLAGIIFDSLKLGKQHRVSDEKTMDYFKEGGA